MKVMESACRLTFFENSSKKSPCLPYSEKVFTRGSFFFRGPYTPVHAHKRPPAAGVWVEDSTLTVGTVLLSLAHMAVV
jgi:hypothetical protein